MKRKLISLRLPEELTKRIETRISYIYKMTGVKVSRQKVIEACLSDMYLSKEA